MLGLRRLNSGDWNKPPVLTAARRIFARALAEKYSSRPLGDMASFVNGTSYDRGKLVSGSKPIIRISNITDPSSDYIETIEEFDEKYHVAPGDLLVSWSASFKSTMWPGPAGILNQHIFKVTARSGYSRPFIRHAIEAAFDEMQQNVVGIGMMHLRRRDFLGHAVPAPPKSIQNAVAGYLDWIEASGERPEPKLPAEFSEQQRIVAKIKQLAAKIDEARGLRHRADIAAVQLLSSGIGRVFDELSREHEVRPFGSFSPHVTSGPRSWAKHYTENGHRFYRAQDVGPHGEILGDSKVFIDPPPGKQGRTAMLEPGDLMIVITGATVGRCTLFTEIHEPGFVSQHVAICRLPKRDVFPEYALWRLLDPRGQEQLLGQRYGQGKPGLNLTNIRSLELPVPPLDEQRRIVAYLDNLQAKVGRLKALQAQTAAELDALLPSILDKAFKGEL